MKNTPILWNLDMVAETLLDNIFSEFSSRYRNIQTIFLNHFREVEHLLTIDEAGALSENKKLLTGAYFTMEYSI